MHNSVTYSFFTISWQPFDVQNKKISWESWCFGSKRVEKLFLDAFLLFLSALCKRCPQLLWAVSFWRCYITSLIHNTLSSTTLRANKTIKTSQSLLQCSRIRCIWLNFVLYDHFSNTEWIIIQFHEISLSEFCSGIANTVQTQLKRWIFSQLFPYW